MEVPEIFGYQVLGEVGQGASGSVYEAVSSDGRHWAIKVFDSMSSNTSLFERQVKRVIEGGAIGVTVEVVAQALEARPPLVVMPFLAGGGGGSLPCNLQLREREGLGWGFLLRLAEALASLHRAKVAHGNLKPGNIFLGKNDEPLLADYACGLMPGVLHYQYSDAILYAPPEQLRDPGGYLEEAGYGWDVFAFGVLAYRVLFGVFPRADELFAPVSPDFGSAERFEIEADHHGVARALEEAGPVSWPGEGIDEAEAARRRVLDVCLHLDPRERPADMLEVARMLRSIEADLAAGRKREALVAAKENAERRRRSTQKVMMGLSAAALVLGGGWVVTEVVRRQEAREAAGELARQGRKAGEEIRGLEDTVAGLTDDQTRLAGERARALDDLAAEQGKATGELRLAHAVNDHLFDWLLETGIQDLPTLEGRRGRLVVLLARIDEQIAGLSERSELSQELIRLRLRGAEVALAAGDLDEGEKRLVEVLEQGGLSDRLSARARLRVLLLRSRRDPESLFDRLAGDERAIRSALAGDPAALLRAGGALALVKARMWEARQEKERALEEYLASLSCYRELEEQFPENAILSLQVARGYLSAARAAEGEGVAGNPAKLRAEAAKAFLALAQKEKNPSPEILYQIAAARAGQAIALWQQGDVFAAEKLAREGIPELVALQGKMPGDVRVTVDLVSQQGIVATALRDEGKSKEARAMLELGIARLKGCLKEAPDQGPARYLLASLQWQLSGVLGQEGEAMAELAMGKEARDGLTALLEGGPTNPDPDKVRRSLAYLCGDLGHAADLHGKRDLAAAYLTECRNQWRELVSRHGEDPECQEGLQWALDRLTAFGIK